MSESIKIVQTEWRGKLAQIEARAKLARKTVKEPAHIAEVEIRANLNQARERLQKQKIRALRTIARLKSQASEHINEAGEGFAGWTGDHKVERADQYACDAIDLVSAAINVAEEAILNAMVAHLDAEASVCAGQSS